MWRRTAVIATIVLAGCSGREPASGARPAPPTTQPPASPPAALAPTATADVWPVASAPRSSRAPWPKDGGRWAVDLLGQPDMTLYDNKQLEVRSPIPSRRIVDVDGLTYSFGSTIGQNLYFVRVILPGAGDNPTAARAWFGVPEGEPIPARNADEHLEITFNGDEVEIELWPNEARPPELDLHAIRGAIQALDDELLAAKTEHKIRFWWDYSDENPRDLTLNLIAWDGCAEHGDAWLAGFRTESPTSARRRALKAIGFRRVTCSWTRTFKTYEFP